MEPLGFFLYIIFFISWFLHLGSRFTALGTIRFDLLLVISVFLIYLTSVDKSQIKGYDNPCYRRLLILIFFIIATTPLVEWPGSVIRYGIPNFVKAVVFFFFTVWFIQTEERLRILVTTFVACQSFRVLEPLYLHVTQGYWGSKASMADWQYMNRLSGAPYDVINPNGLAFVILSILPFLLYLYRENFFWKFAAMVIMPSSLYAMYLTGSRSGMLGLGLALCIFAARAKHKATMAVLILTFALFAFVQMHGAFKDRYESIFSSDTANASTAQGRIDGVIRDLKVALRKPIFGYGLGASAEANANFGGVAQISHDLYTETFQEIGIIGLGIFLSFIYMIFKNLFTIHTDYMEDGFLLRLRSALIVFAPVNLFFGLASYGLSSYEWYFLAGLSLILFENLKGAEPTTESPQNPQ